MEAKLLDGDDDTRLKTLGAGEPIGPRVFSLGRGFKLGPANALKSFKQRQQAIVSGGSSSIGGGGGGGVRPDTPKQMQR